MSVQAIDHVLKNSTQRGGARLVLIVVASHINTQGVAWPSYDTLASECCLQRRQVIRHVNALHNAGELVVHRGLGPKGTNRYAIPEIQRGVLDDTKGRVVDDTPHPRKGGVSFRMRGVSSTAQKGCHPRHPNQIQNRR